MKESIIKIRDIVEVIEVKSKIDIVKDDTEDNKIIECAVDGKVDYIISKDKHLLKIKIYNGIRIIHPEEFLEICS